MKVYISASTQKENTGIAPYGNEQDRMHWLADKVADILKKQRLTVYRNQKDWTLSQTCCDFKKTGAELFIDCHTNAGAPSAQGTEIYYGSNEGKTLATNIYKYVAPLSPGADRGVKDQKVLYSSGLFVINNTTPKSCLIEYIFHTNKTEVDDLISRVDMYAKATARGIMETLGLVWQDNTALDNITALVNKVPQITNKALWIEYCLGKKPVNPEYLQFLLARLIK